MAALHAHSSLLDKCAGEIDQLVESTITAVRQWGETAKSALVPIRDRVNQEVSVALQEAEATLYQARPNLTSELVKKLRENAQVAPLFAYTLTPPVVTPGSFSYSHAFQLERCLPCLSPVTLSYFDCEKKEWLAPIPLSQAINHSPDTRYVAINDNRLFVCGRGADGPQKTAYILTLDGTVDQLPDMREPRSASGLVYCPKAGLNHVFVFGGFKGDRYSDVKTGEKLCIDGKVWVETPELPEMTVGRSYFTPCLCGERVYLIGGLTRCAEFYSLGSNTMTQLAFHLRKAEKCCSLLSPPGLLIVSKSRFYRAAISETGEFYSQSSPGKNSKAYFSLEKRGLVLSDTVFLMGASHCAWFSLKTGLKLGQSNV